MRSLLRCALPLLVAACATTALPAPPPVSPEASAALAEARRLVRAGAPSEDPDLLAVLDRVRELEPDWVAPQRMLDDLALSRLQGPRALEARREALSLDPRDASQQYLTGRLEGEYGSERFDFAASLDPHSAWAHHGRAWTAARARHYRTARRLERDALRLARDPWEAAFFRVSLARFALSDRDPAAALSVMRDPAARVGLSDDDRAWFEIETMLVELRQPNNDVVRDAYARGYALLRQVDLGAADLRRVVEALATRRPDVDPTGNRLQLALASRPGEARRRLRVRLLQARDGGELAAALAAETPAEADFEVPRGVLFRAGDFGASLERWRDDLPPQVLDDEGLPRDERLRRVWSASRALDIASATTLVDFGDALIDAGWFAEAAEVSRVLAPLDADAALALYDRALAGVWLVDELRQSLEGSARRLPRFDDVLAPPAHEGEPTAERDRGSGPPDPEDGDRLDRWLASLAPVLARANEVLGGETDEARLRETLLASPRLEFGSIGGLLHPGVVFSADDEAEGLGAAGDRVPGIAAELDAIGRFATIGTLVGRGLDGMILRRVHVEERRGEHLGVPWSGTVAWCEGLDAGGRNGGDNLRISGAALHEGYWVDIGSVRRDIARWAELEDLLDAEGGDDVARRALASTGLPLRVSEATPDARARERRALGPSLDQSRRVRLALMVERRAAGAGGVRFGELVDAVAVHEEGHLCDRTRFLPLHRNLGRALLLILDNGFSPRAIQSQLEYRAQLTALCALAEPRIAFADVVLAAEVPTDGPLPHARAYRELLADFLRVLDEERERDPARWSMLDGDRTLLHQLHRLGAEDVREVALRLARAEGL